MLNFHGLASLLFLPADRGDRLSKAANTKAGAIILDLEDGVAVQSKLEARAGVAALILTLRSLGRGSVVRVNADAVHDDLSSLCAAWPDAVMLPKVEASSELVALREALLRLGAPPDLQVVSLIETPRGIFNLPQIVLECRSQDALAFGSEDYATAMGNAPTSEVLSFAAHSIALAARAYALPAFGVIGSIAEIKDQSAFRTSCRLARLAGFTGILAIHPAQVESADQTFLPTQDELDWARAVLADAANAGGGAIMGQDGQMIDKPIVDRASRILARSRP